MAYTQDNSECLVVPAGTAAIGVETVSASVAVNGEYIVLRNCKIKRIMFAITTAIAASTTAPVVTFRKRLIYNSSGSQSTIGTLTLPDLTAAGIVVYKDISPISLSPGQSICCDHTTQAVDGSSAAGAGFYGFELEFDPEVAANSSKLLASA